MRNKFIAGSMVILLTTGLTGCLIRSYTIKQPRLDQGLEGNRGYIAGKVPAQVAADKERKTYREHKVIEIEFTSKKDKDIPLPREVVIPEAAESSFSEAEETVAVDPVSQASLNIPRIEDETAAVTEPVAVEAVKAEEPAVKFDIYEVKLGDTLQKISQKEYGTWKKWRVIYEANKDKLRTPDKVLSGQKLKIPR